MTGRKLSAQLVRCLLREQFPQWAREPVRPVEVQGWDNRTFRVGDTLSVRLPSAEGYAAAVAKEQRWLPVLAPQLPVPIPVPLAEGRPGCGFRWPWSVYGWLPGTPARAGQLTDPVGFAAEVASVLATLQSCDTASGPAPGPHSGWRGGPLIRYDAETRATVALLAGVVEVADVLALWDAAIAAPYTGPPVWVHGDMTGSNLLVEEGCLAGLIDFGSSAVGDPACDLVLAWTLLEGDGRAAFRAGVPADEAGWARARGWAMWKALLTVAQGADAPGAERRYGWRCPSTELIEDLVADHAAAEKRA